MKMLIPFLSLGRSIRTVETVVYEVKNYGNQCDYVQSIVKALSVAKKVSKNNGDGSLRSKELKN